MAPLAHDQEPVEGYLAFLFCRHNGFSMTARDNFRRTP
jgi:hypothetical protein